MSRLYSDIWLMLLFSFLLLFWHCLLCRSCLFFIQLDHLATPCFCWPLPYGMPVPPSRKHAFDKFLYVRHPWEPRQHCSELHDVWMRTLITRTWRSLCTRDPLPYGISAQEREQLKTSWFFGIFIKLSFLLCLFSFCHIWTCMWSAHTHWPSCRYSKPYAQVHICPFRHIPHVSLQKHASIVNAQSPEGEGCTDTPMSSLQVDSSVLTSCLCPVQKQHCVDSCTPVQYACACVSLAARLYCFASATFSSAWQYYQKCHLYDFFFF